MGRLTRRSSAAWGLQRIGLSREAGKPILEILLIIGGVAASLHGSARVTNDLDICYDITPDNIERLASLLRELRAELRNAEPGLPFVIDARTLRDSPMLTLTTTEGFLDVMDHVPGVGAYSDAIATAELVEWDDLSFSILSLPSLILAKRAAGRRKDHEHLIELEALGMLKREEGWGG